MSKDAPSNASELVGERDGEDIVMQPLLGRLEPRLEPVTIPAPGLDQYNPCGLNEQNAQIAIAALRLALWWPWLNQTCELSRVRRRKH
jgi:hypothetical protein